MREILFRGKDLQEQNGWLYGYFYKSDINKRERESGKASLIFTPNCDTFIYVPEYHNSWMVKAETVGQYTGLKDKNGTRIFEGDIIRHHYKNPIENGYTSDKGVVKWDCKECFFYRTSLSGKDKTISVDCIYEVIGNIYDNPELLE